MDKVTQIMERWNALQPLSERDRELLSRRFTIDFNYNSNHIEGNTLTYGQTEILLLFGKIIGEAEVKDVQEMTASNVGLKMMREEAQLNDVPLTQNFIRTLGQILTYRVGCHFSLSLHSYPSFRRWEWAYCQIDGQLHPLPTWLSHDCGEKPKEK